VHRVQRVPATESKGRVHTSAVAVVVRLVPVSLSIVYMMLTR
jgi:protein subunit release factor A